MNESGDEWHYLIRCTNQKISDTRSQFVVKIKNIQPQLANFKMADLMKYCLAMYDTSTQEATAQFISQLINEYSEEDEANRPGETCCLM